jgi:hypothetical protein
MFGNFQQAITAIFSHNSASSFTVKAISNSNSSKSKDFQTFHINFITDGAEFLKKTD